MIDRSHLAADAFAAAAKVSPAAVVAYASFSGWGVQQWMYAATTGYILLQAAYLLWKWRRESKGVKTPEVEE